MSSKRRRPEPAWDPCQIKLTEAIVIAQRAADEYRLPQTVFIDSNSGGWSNTNPMATRLLTANCDRTVLPTNYFI